MMLKHAGDKERRGMSVEIRREIGNADLIVPIDLAAPQWRWRRWAAVRHPSAGGAELVFCSAQDVRAALWREGAGGRVCISRASRPRLRQTSPLPPIFAGQSR